MQIIHGKLDRQITEHTLTQLLKHQIRHTDKKIRQHMHIKVFVRINQSEHDRAEQWI